MVGPALALTVAATRETGQAAMWLRIQHRFFITLLLTVILVAGGTGTFFYHSAQHNLLLSLRHRMHDQLARLAPTLDASAVRAALAAEDAASLETVLEEMVRATPGLTRARVLRALGVGPASVLFDSLAGPHRGPPPADADAVRLGRQEPAVASALHEGRGGERLSGYAPLPDGQGEYLLALEMDASAVAARLQDLRYAGLGALGLALVLTLVISRLLTGHFLKPIYILASRAEEIAAGRLGGQVDLHTYDELDRLIDAFNTMSERLARSRSERERVYLALKESREQMEDRVRRRTVELERVNAELRREVEERQRAEDALWQAARTDFLTGLLTRRAAVELLEHESQQSRRRGQGFCVILGDIDRFKQINDCHGHEAGDAVLQEVARALQRAVRAQDAVARWGGEEMLLLLPATPLTGAVHLAEKIRAAVEALEPRFQGMPIPITISLGVSDYTPEHDIDECIRRADLAMYEAKAAGRNRVRSRGTDAPPPEGAPPAPVSRGS